MPVSSFFTPLSAPTSNIHFVDIDLSRWVTILAVVLLIPGLTFLVLVVVYVAFAPKRSENRSEVSEAKDNDAS